MSYLKRRKPTVVSLVGEETSPEETLEHHKELRTSTLGGVRLNGMGCSLSLKLCTEEVEGLLGAEVVSLVVELGIRGGGLTQMEFRGMSVRDLKRVAQLFSAAANTLQEGEEDRLSPLPEQTKDT